MVKGQLEISRRLPKKLIAVKQKDGRDKSKTRRLLLKDLIYVIFFKTTNRTMCVENTIEVYQKKP